MAASASLQDGGVHCTPCVALASLDQRLMLCHRAPAEVPDRADSGFRHEPPMPTHAPVRNWPLDPGSLEADLAGNRIEILARHRAPGGLSGASRLTMRLLDRDLEVSAKWKRIPRHIDGLLGSPRKEIAAYEVQKLVLDPEDYVVPTVVLRRIPDDALPPPRRAHRGVKVRNERFRLGVLSIWLENVTVPEVLFDRERFEREPLYARHLANFNLVTYLINHDDARTGNFLVSRDEADRRVFSIDNGVAFGGIWYNWFVRNWNHIRVPALPCEGIERLRRVRSHQLRRFAKLVELHRCEDGHLVPNDEGRVELSDPSVKGPGEKLAIGLTHKEIEDLERRIESLLERVDRGEIALLAPSSETGAR